MIKKVFLLYFVLQFFAINHNLSSQTLPEVSKLKFSKGRNATEFSNVSLLKDINRKNRISAGVGVFTSGDNSAGVTLDYLRDIKRGFYAGGGIGLYESTMEAELKIFYDVIYKSNLFGILPGIGLSFNGFNSDGINLNPLIFLKADLHISDLNSVGVEFKGVFSSENDVYKLNPFLSVNLGFKF